MTKLERKADEIKKLLKKRDELILKGQVERWPACVMFYAAAKVAENQAMMIRATPVKDFPDKI